MDFQPTGQNCTGTILLLQAISATEGYWRNDLLRQLLGRCLVRRSAADGQSKSAEDSIYINVLMIG
jgi:hypothetical protein